MNLDIIYIFMITDFRYKYLLIKHIKSLYNMIDDIFYYIGNYVMLLIKHQIIDMLYIEIFYRQLDRCFIQYRTHPTKVMIFQSNPTRKKNYHCLKCKSRYKYLIYVITKHHRHRLTYCSQHIKEIYDEFTIFNDFINKYLNSDNKN